MTPRSEQLWTPLPAPPVKAKQSKGKDNGNGARKGTKKSSLATGSQRAFKDYDVVMVQGNDTRKHFHAKGRTHLICHNFQRDYASRTHATVALAAISSESAATIVRFTFILRPLRKLPPE